MSTSTRDKPWDFSHVLDLVNRLSRPEQPVQSATTQHETPLSKQDSSDDPHDSGIGEDVETKDFAKPSNGLGDFAKIWQYMGVSDHKPAKDKDRGVVRIEDYASDGATYVKPAGKKPRTVTWEDQVSAEDMTGGSATDRSESPDTPKLTKSQRKKKNRRERKAQEAAAQGKSGVVSESEADVLTVKTPAKKAGVHAVAADLARRYNARESSVSAALPSKQTNAKPNDRSPSTPSKNVSSNSTKKAKENAFTNPPHTPPVCHHSQPATTTPTKHTQSASHYGHYNKEKAAWEFHTPSKPSVTQLVPSSVQPPKKKNSFAMNIVAPQQQSQQPSAQDAIKAVQAAMQNVGPNSTPSKRSNNTIEPKIIRSGEDRNWALFLRLLNEHVEERKYLVAPMNMANHNNDPNGIHVFVDASNIFIGFNDQLKRERGMPTHWHTSAANLSFDALALLMERRRPVAKRVLVGSTPSVAAFDTARAVGYEVSLLDKVYKARELTERQIYFRHLDAVRGSGGKRAKAPAPAANGNISSGSETTGDASSGPQYAPAKMIEQGVDEILHLKILESVVDSEVPSTMVIATGDAAQAEYSQGFMAMTERALKKGWKVELVSWSKNISSMYMRREFREKWGERFKVVFLDEYAEELLDM